MPISRGEIVSTIDIVGHLEIEFMDGQSIVSPSFNCRLSAPEEAFLPQRRVGVNLEDYIRLLQSKDVAVVESVFVSLWGLKDQQILEALSHFDEARFEELEETYNSEVYSELPEEVRMEEVALPEYYLPPDTWACAQVHAEAPQRWRSG